MKLIVKIFIVVVTLVLVVVFLKPNKPTPAPVYTNQQKEGGGITMNVIPKVLASNKSPSFEITLDTHSVDLSFDVAATAKLEDVTKTTYGWATWEGDPPSGHHRKGTLTFSEPLKDSADVVTLTFSDMVDTDWEFRFDL